MHRFNTGVYGATGRMGRTICELVQGEYADRLVLEACMDSATELSTNALTELDIVIDFSLPEGIARLADALRSLPNARPLLVSGTTGLPPVLMSKLVIFALTADFMQ